MSKIDAILLLDVQDDFHPPEVGSDDVIKDFAEALTQAGLVGNFLFHADRSLLLKERGRTDVIRSLEPHSVGTHLPSSAHPAVPEYAAQGDWFTALREVERREMEGANIIRDVFHRDPCAISQHGVHTAPHVFPVAAKLGVPYIYGFPAAEPKRSVSWYGGALNIPWHPDPHGPVPFFEVGDESWSDDNLFEQALSRLAKFLDRHEQAGQPFMAFFLSHPYRVRSVEPVDYWQRRNGKNAPRELWGKQGGPQLRTAEQMAVARRNMARLMEHVRQAGRINVISIPEAASKYGYQPQAINQEQLRKAAAVLRQHRSEYAPPVSEAQERPPLDIPIGGPISPAETLLGLAESLVAYARGEGLPAEVRRFDVLGPLENPIIIPEASEISWEALTGRINELLSSAKATGYLPANVGPDGARIGLGSLYRTLADAYHAASNGDVPQTVQLPSFPRYPRAALEIGHRFLDLIEWGIVDPDLNPWNLVKHGKLQTWTLKPAWDLSV